MKRDRDKTDFRAIRDSYKTRDVGCVFCGITKSRITAENELAYAVYDAFPVTKFHTLVIPKRHASSYFDLHTPETGACNQLLTKIKLVIQERDLDVTGWNVGINDGEAAGQTVFHCHIHLIPRRKGDVATPSGA